jgi:hypothetical protein
MTRFDRFFVWIGGALFVLSLAACAYWFLFVWTAASATARSSSGVAAAIAIDAALFSAFALHHSLFARDAIKRRIAAVIPERLLRSFYVWTASLLLLAVLALWRPIPGVVYSVVGWRSIVHAALQLSGLWLVARSAATIDPLELAGIKPASGAESLQTTGPYRWVRHPIYLGWLLAVNAAAEMTANRLTFALLSSAYLLLAVPWEERSLRRIFGEPYARYQRAVRWRVIPYIY